jgi:FtsZ-binding cell division protein ZapB
MLQKDTILRILELSTENRELEKVVSSLQAAGELLARENDALKEKVAHLEAEVVRYKAGMPPHLAA